MSAVDDRYLRYFVVAIDLGSLSKAAIELGVAQPALSQRIAALEREFGTVLMTRSPTGVRATQAGKVLYRHARQVLRQMSNAHVEVRQADMTLSGDVIVGMSPPVALIHTGELFTALRHTHPDILLHVFESVSSYLYEMLANGRIDLCVTHVDPSISHKVHHLETVYREPLCLVGRPDRFAVGVGDVSLVDLARIPLVLPGKSQQMRRTIERECQRQGLSAKVVGEIDSFQGLFDIASRGEACTMAPLSVLPHVLPARPLLAASYTQPHLLRELGVCESAAARDSAAIQAVREQLVRQLGQAVDEQGDFVVGAVSLPGLSHPVARDGAPPDDPARIDVADKSRSPVRRPTVSRRSRRS